MRQWDVVVIGAGGSQAQAMIRAAARARDVSRWLAVDRAWQADTCAATTKLGLEVAECDVLDEPDRLGELLASSAVVANLAGPYYRTGAVVLDAAIAQRTHYLDICDDADVTLPLLARAARAQEAGVRALIGMGSSPGTTNVLIKAAVDYLGPVSDVDIYWTVDVADMTDAAVRHFWHCFNLVEADGTTHPVRAWDQLDAVDVEFPGTVGPQQVVRLAHPEPITIPTFLPVEHSANFGAITPREALLLGWSLAYAIDPQRATPTESAAGGGVASVTDDAVSVFRRYRDSRPPGPRVGSGLVIDIHSGGDGLRYSSGAETEMAEATGVPAAAGLVLMLDGDTPTAGVFPPECLSPAAFFAALRRVSLGGGGLMVHRLRGGVAAERLRIRDVIAAGSPVEA